MSIKLWPQQERPRERLLQQGANVLSDAELLAIFLRTGGPKQSALDMARNMLNRYGNLYDLLNSDHEHLMTCRGMGPAKLSHLMAALELGKRYVSHQLQHNNNTLNQPHLVKQYLIQQLTAETREVFAIMLLDSQLKLIQFEKVFYGTVTQCAVHLREILRLAISHHAVHLIVAHNHPDAPAAPSPADIELTKQLCAACNLLEIRLIDHIIIGKNQTISLAESNLMPV